jgi:hypothetical protein
MSDNTEIKLKDIEKYIQTRIDAKHDIVIDNYGYWYARNDPRDTNKGALYIHANEDLKRLSAADINKTITSEIKEIQQLLNKTLNTEKQQLFAPKYPDNK